MCGGGVEKLSIAPGPLDWGSELVVAPPSVTGTQAGERRGKQCLRPTQIIWGKQDQVCGVSLGLPVPVTPASKDKLVVLYEGSLAAL